MRAAGVLRIVVMVFTLAATWLFASTYLKNTSTHSISVKTWLILGNMVCLHDIVGRKIHRVQFQAGTGNMEAAWKDGLMMKQNHQGSHTNSSTKPPLAQNKCNNRRPCPEHTFSFKIISGAANVVGPSICFDGNMIMSNVKNNVGRGLNIALINGITGQLIKIDSFDMYSGDIENLLNFLKGISKGTLVLLASYDDPATKLNDEARKIFSDLGSKYASQIGFRDNWIFLGGSGLKNKSPFEQHLENNKETNKYDGWPEVLEMEGCVPKKIE